MIPANFWSMEDNWTLKSEIIRFTDEVDDLVQLFPRIVLVFMQLALKFYNPLQSLRIVLVFMQLALKFYNPLQSLI